MPEVPPPALLLRRVGGLGHNIRYAEPLADERPEPVGRLVIGMVGEPDLGWLRPALDLPEIPMRNLAALFAEPCLPPRVAGIIAAEIRGECHCVAGARERRNKRPRHCAVAGGDRMVGRLQ